MENKKPLADLKYSLALLNPFTPYVHFRDDLLGLNLSAYKFDVVGRVLFKTGYWDKALSRWLLERFRNSRGQFVDVGANLGYETCLLSAIATSGKVVAIEPEPENLKLLRLNLEKNNLKNVAIYPCAVGAAAGVATLRRYKHSNRGKHSLIGTGSEFASAVDVEVKTLDEILEHEFPNGDIDFIKIDVEGFEPEVIAGASNTLHRTRALCLEYIPEFHRENPEKFSSMISCLDLYFSELFKVSETEVSIFDAATLGRLADPVDLLWLK